MKLNELEDLFFVLEIVYAGEEINNPFYQELLGYIFDTQYYYIFVSINKVFQSIQIKIQDYCEFMIF